MTVESLLAIASEIVQTSCKLIQGPDTDQSSSLTTLCDIYQKQKEEE